MCDIEQPRSADLFERSPSLGSWDRPYGFRSLGFPRSYRYRYEVNVNYRQPLEENGLVFSGMSPDGSLPEIVELAGHPWYFGVQFHPELKSKPFEPHPIFASFIAAAFRQSRLV